MQIEKILVVSPMYHDIQDIIEKMHLNKVFRFKSDDQVLKQDYLWADAIVSFRLPENFEFGNIKWAHSLGAGVDGFLNNRQWNSDVILTRMTNAFGKKISEYCLSYILQELQYHHLFNKLKGLKLWKPIEPKTLESQKVVIYGTGEIGQEMAKYFSFMGMTVKGISLSGQPKPFFTQVEKVTAESTLLHDTHWVISTLPLTKQTFKLFNDDFFSKLHQVGFINVGRGDTVDQQAMIRALEKGQVKKVILDVFPEEPLPEHSPLWEHPDVIITPHISAITTPQEGVECFVETMKKIESKTPLKNKVELEKGY